MKSSRKRYREVLGSVDRCSPQCERVPPPRCSAGRGCALCCYGLSLPGALEVAEGLSALPEETRAQVKGREVAIQETIAREAPELWWPYLLGDSSEERIDQIVDRAGNPRCPFLGEANECLIYEHRLLACRLEGAPMVDIQDGLFGDWCELNFTTGVPPEAMTDLCQDYYRLQGIEQDCTESLSASLLARRQGQVTTCIPSLVVAFTGFWKPLLRETEPEV